MCLKSIKKYYNIDLINSVYISRVSHKIALIFSSEFAHHILFNNNSEEIKCKSKWVWLKVNFWQKKKYIHSEW